jgi:hypothetical protein
MSVKAKVKYIGASNIPLTSPFCTRITRCHRSFLFSVFFNKRKCILSIYVWSFKLKSEYLEYCVYDVSYSCTLLHDWCTDSYICFAILIDQVTHPWNIDDSGEPSQLSHGRLLVVWLWIYADLLVYKFWLLEVEVLHRFCMAYLLVSVVLLLLFSWMLRTLHRWRHRSQCAFACFICFVSWL